MHWPDSSSEGNSIYSKTPSNETFQVKICSWESPTVCSRHFGKKFCKTWNALRVLLSINVIHTWYSSNYSPHVIQARNLSAIRHRFHVTLRIVSSWIFFKQIWNKHIHMCHCCSIAKEKLSHTVEELWPGPSPGFRSMEGQKSLGAHFQNAILDVRRGSRNEWGDRAPLVSRWRRPWLWLSYI